MKKTEEKKVEELGFEKLDIEMKPAEEPAKSEPDPFDSSSSISEEIVRPVKRSRRRVASEDSSEEPVQAGSNQKLNKQFEESVSMSS